MSLVCLGILGLLAMTAMYWREWSAITHEASDFSVFWVAGQQVGVADLYNEAPHQEFQDAHGRPPYLRVFIRFPWQALIAKPFTLLPYGIAVWAWNGLMIASVIVFLASLPASRRWLGALGFCWSVPLANALTEGQDTELALAAFGVSMWAIRRDRPWLAGAALAVCGLKIHILLPVFLVIILRNEAKLLGGLLAVLGSLTALSFFLQPDWITGMLTTDFGALFWNPWAMPNLYHLFWGHPYLEMTAGACVLAVCGFAANRLEREFAFSLAFAAGVILTRHSFSQDLMFVYPLALLLSERPGITNRIIAASILSPVPLALYVDRSSSLAAQVMAVAVTLSIAWCGFVALRERPRAAAAEPLASVGQIA